MALTKVLITVKTYPTLSMKYDELVCTAGFREDGSWIRLYPVPYRKLKNFNKYEKYRWVELDLERNTSDFRPESFRPKNVDDIKLLELIDTDNGKWTRRREIVLKSPKSKVHTNLTDLIGGAKDKKVCTSLAVFKPAEIFDFKIEKADEQWDAKKIENFNEHLKQLNLFGTESNKSFKVVDKMPYKFSYCFKDDSGKQSKMMIEDWEIGMLYWNCLAKAEGDEREAVKKVKQKYYDDFVKKKDLYLFLGTTCQHHFTAKNPFLIIGLFVPPVEQQLSLFS